MLKHAVATLADGIELLLKARLEAQHWHLLFKEVDSADRNRSRAEGDSIRPCQTTDSRCLA